MRTLMNIDKGHTLVYLNHAERKIEKVVSKNLKFIEYDFPGIADKGYNYLKLENIMKYYMKMKGTDKTLLDIVIQIQEEGFVYPLKPSMRISIEVISE